MPDLPVNFRDDQREQARIEMAVWAAFPEGAYYHNIVTALAAVLTDAVFEMTKRKLRYHKKRAYAHDKDPIDA